MLLLTIIILRHRQNSFDLCFSLHLINEGVVEILILTALAEAIRALFKPLAHVLHFLYHFAHLLLFHALFIVLKTLQLRVGLLRPDEAFRETRVIHRIYDCVSILLCYENAITEPLIEAFLGLFQLLDRDS